MGAAAEAKVIRSGTTRWLFCVVLGWAVAGGSARSSWAAEPPSPALPAPLPRARPLEPAEAATSFRVQRSFRMDLLAAEPLVTDPVAIDYDENGRAFVVEMCDYPYTDKATDRPFVERTTDQPLGRVRILEDTDGDGRFDRSVVFADALSWPTGLAFWQRGVFVAATPDVWYLEDRDGDGRADVRRRVFTGFRKFNVQAVMNNLKWGLDHRIYGAGSGNGGTIRHLDRPEEKPSVLGRHDYRFDARDERLELLSGGARFGNTFDDWGNRFLCNIRNPVQHVVLPSHYLARNPHLLVKSAVHDAAAAGDTLPVFRVSPVEPWRALRAQRWAAEAGQSYPRSETHAAGYFTSSSGVTIYRGAAYPPEFYGNAFLGEVAANAVHRQIVEPEGVTFRARRADEGVEFVASTDNWFRPVNFVNAPDGTLHVLDMYRETIEHPWSIPDDIKAQLDLESGRDRGRIYRLSPPGFVVPPPPRLGQASTPDLVATLANPNSWWRETAHRLLFQRQDVAAVDPLRELLQTGSRDTARLHALWSLAGMDRLTEADLLVALGDASAGVREHAVRLAEPLVLDRPRLHERLCQLASDPSIRVRFQVALSIGVSQHPTADAALAAIARRDAADPWLRTAVLSSATRRSGALCGALWNDPGWTVDAPSVALLRDAAAVVGARRDGEEIRALLAVLAEAPACHTADGLTLGGVRTEALVGLGEGLKRAGLPLTKFATDTEPKARQLVRGLFDEAALAAKNGQATVDERIQAIQLLALGDFASVGELLTSLLSAQEPIDVQLAAVRGLARIADPDIARRFIAAYPGLTPPVRTELVEALLSRADRHGALLDALETRIISIAQIPATRRTQLIGSNDEGLKRRAERLFASDVPGPRREAIEQYRPALRMPADRLRGKQVFLRECAGCHRLEGQGFEVGPNLETVRNRSADELLTNVLDPNREVSPNYLEYIVTLTDGRVLIGVVANETATSLDLRRAQGTHETVLRTNIEQMVGSGKSLMPEGLEQRLTRQELADLIAWLLVR